MLRKDYEKRLQSQIVRKEQRSLAARRRKKNAVWYGLGMFGLIGWSIVLPAFLGLLIGYWISAKWKLGLSVPLSFLFLGIFVGSANAWFWIMKERKSIEKDDEKDE